MKGICRLCKMEVDSDDGRVIRSTPTMVLFIAGGKFHEIHSAGTRMAKRFSPVVKSKHSESKEKGNGKFDPGAA
jgi:hypothetical protein